MRRTTAALLTALLAIIGAMALPATAQADAPGSCTTHYEGPVASASCTGVSPGTMWQTRAACFYLIGNQPIDYWVAGPVVTGDGTSIAFCNRGQSWATRTIRPTVVGVTGSQGRLVGYGGKCVDIRSGKTTVATPVQIYDCNGTGAQWWTLGTDHTVRALGMCLNVVWGGHDNGTKVEIYDCQPWSQGEQWLPQADGSLKNVLTGKCLDDLGFNTNNGTQLGIWDCNGLPNQKWTLTA
ncbi:ricin-type beta-trefoil lectin domain protein [Streptomyces sp. NPDC050485]|uniref:ricin-type beta-trefoil lectin domain protein n=1 Tax=Streptomyces sp. NPDC050485 TaxID=3365617 RepID=UPI0037BA1307